MKTSASEGDALRHLHSQVMLYVPKALFWHRNDVASNLLCNQEVSI